MALEDIRDKKCPRTLIFCKGKDVSPTGLINASMLRILSPAYYLNETISLINIYHKDTLDTTKAAIAENMANSDGDIKIRFATDSAGMGVNFAGTSQIVYYGPPRDMDTLVQQIGRVGRTCEPSDALLLYHGKQ